MNLKVSKAASQLHHWGQTTVWKELIEIFLQCLTHPCGKNTGGGSWKFLIHRLKSRTVCSDNRKQ